MLRKYNLQQTRSFIIYNAVKLNLYAIYSAIQARNAKMMGNITVSIHLHVENDDSSWISEKIPS